MTKVVAMYHLQSTGDVPAFIGLFSSMENAKAFLKDKDKRKFYTREYIIDNLLIS